MRTRGPSHDENRRHILLAARAHVLEDGHQNFSLRAVAKGAGFSPASLYEYFSGRDEIVAALAAQASRSLRSALERAAKGLTGSVALVAVGEGYVRWANHKKEDFMLLFTQLASKRRDLTQELPESSPNAIVVSTIRAAVESGELCLERGKSIEQMAYGLWATAHGMAMLQLTHLAGFKADFRAADRAILEALVAGWHA